MDLKDLLASLVAIIGILACYSIILFVGFHFGPLGAIVAAILVIKLITKAIKNLP